MKVLQPISAPWCMKCGKGLLEDEKICQDCQDKEHYFERGRALYQYSSAAPSIYRFKYGNRREYADFFGEELAEYLDDFISGISPDAFIPVPLHKKRMRQRGYNQAQLLATTLGNIYRIPVYNNLVERVKNTVPLKKLNPQERQNNLKKAFIITENDVKLETVIIIDDIYTTGATINEIAKLLRNAGVKHVFFITLACGEGV